jgi:hypothetical protein
MKIIFKKNKYRWQKWCIWFVYDNGKSTRLNENYNNLDDAVDTAEMLKSKLRNAEIILPI